MVAVQVLSSIAMIAFSFIGGFVLFYLTSPLTKDHKKLQMEEMVNQIINVVLFLWLSKIILNITVFVKDPIAILAYPANSHALYLAIGLTMLTIAYKGLRKKTSVSQFLFSFIPVFIAASFLYEFMQIVWGDMGFAWQEIGLLGGLVLVYMLIHDHVSDELSTLLVTLGWGVGKLILWWTLPFTTVFGYMINSWFIIFIVVIISLYNVFVYRKRVSE